MPLYSQLLVDIWVIFQFGLLLVGRSWLEDAAGMTLMRTDPALELRQEAGERYWEVVLGPPASRGAFPHTYGGVAGSEGFLEPARLFVWSCQ